MTMTLSCAFKGETNTSIRPATSRRMRFSTERSGLRLEVSALLQAKAPHTPVEVGSVGLKGPRGFRHVALRLRQGRHDEAALVFVQRVAQGSARWSGERRDSR